MLPAGTRVGPYEVVSWLGAGGMGEVYRARDTTLGREVALKTLPEELGGQPERLARLKQEARILASLNHPGIATLHGLEQSDGVPVLVMELVEGETLAERLRRGALPWRQAATIAHQIALALEAAHENGILHRDLKPGNIRLAPDGRVKLLDFGLAKAVRKAAVDSRLDTDTSPHSEPGTVMGTAPYMSPEQARGQEPDRRGDIWAFGCVLYQMLAGKRAFEGATYSDTVAAVLDREPDWHALPPETPPPALRLLRRCLQKEKGQRLHDIADARLELEEIAVSVSPPPAAWRGLIRSRLLWLLVGAAAAVAGVWALGTSRLVAPPAVVRWAIPVSSTDNVQQVTLSPDATHLAYVALRDGHSQIYVRALDRFAARPIPGTEDGDGPFFSPDGRWLGFTGGDSKLKKVPLSGGAPLTLCDKGSLFGATWGLDDTIVFTGTEGSGLLRVSADGGAPQTLTILDASRREDSHRFPEALPGGEGVVFTVKPDDALSWDDARIEAVSLRTGQRSTLITGGACAHYLAPGHLVYHRTGSLWSAPFDPTRLKVTGPPVLLLEGVSSSGIWGHADFSISRDGSLAYVPGGRRESDRRLVRVDRAGRRQPLTDIRRGFRHLSLSPDGRRLALEIAAPNDQVWVYDLERGTLTLLTTGGSSGTAIWTPDGRRLTFTSDRETPWHLFWQPADGSGPAERLTIHAHPEGQFAKSWSPDGKTLLFVEGRGVWTLQPDGDREPRPVLQGRYAPYAAALSPSGRWFTYVSDESGRDEVYVRPFPGPGSRWTISADGGSEPAWARNGRELFYRNGDRMMAVSVASDATFSASKPRMLFAASRPPHVFRSYEVTPDGEFLMIEPGESDTPATHINVVLNWLQEVGTGASASR